MINENTAVHGNENSDPAVKPAKSPGCPWPSARNCTGLRKGQPGGPLFQWLNAGVTQV
jgi:hypothetical protein